MTAKLLKLLSSLGATRESVPFLASSTSSSIHFQGDVQRRMDRRTNYNVNLRDSQKLMNEFCFWTCSSLVTCRVKCLDVLHSLPVCLGPFLFLFSFLFINLGPEEPEVNLSLEIVLASHLIGDNCCRLIPGGERQVSPGSPGLFYGNREPLRTSFRRPVCGAPLTSAKLNTSSATSAGAVDGGQTDTDGGEEEVEDARRSSTYRMK